MSTDNKLFSISVEAGADLSSSQYKCIQLNSSKKAVDVTAITNIPLGILQNDPVTAQPAHVTPISAGGISLIRLGATLSAGDLIGTGTDGRAVADASTNYNLGILMEGGDADDIVPVLLGSLTATA